jgi:hypothetical protein
VRPHVRNWIWSCNLIQLTPHWGHSYSSSLMPPHIVTQDENESASASSRSLEGVEREDVHSDGRRNSDHHRRDGRLLGVYGADPIKKLHRC